VRIIMIALFVLFVGASTPAISADNDQSPPMLSGQITARGDKEVRIDGQAYGFHRDVTFSNETGHQIRWGDFRDSDFVRFHLRKGQIDQMIRLMPR
jgi:hypothetical protein